MIQAILRGVGGVKITIVGSPEVESLAMGLTNEYGCTTGCLI